MQPQPRDEAIWHVLQLINGNLIDSADKVLYCYYDVDGSTGQFSFGEELAVLSKLRQLGTLTFDEEHQDSKILLGPPKVQVYSFELHIQDTAKLQALYSHHKELANHRVSEEPINLTYDPTSGIGVANNRGLKLRGKNKRVFNRLYADVNKWVPRAAILKAGGYQSSGKQATLDCNTLITNLRKAAILTPQHIVVHDGHFMLKAIIIDD